MVIRRKAKHLRSRECKEHARHPQVYQISAVDYDLSFTKQQFSRAYGDAAIFRARYYRMDELSAILMLLLAIIKTYSLCLSSTLVNIAIS